MLIVLFAFWTMALADVIPLLRRIAAALETLAAKEET
jgi:hypothetical protein